MRGHWLVLLLLLPMAAQAAPKDELAKTEAALKESKARQEKLLKDEKHAEKELAALREKLIRAAAELQKSDALLTDAQKKLADTQAELIRKGQDAVVARHKLDGLARVAIRLGRTPPQAMVLMPTDGKSRIQAAHALSLITSEMKAQAGRIAEQMAALALLTTKQEEEKASAEALKSELAGQKKTFEAALKERKKLRDQITASRQKEDAAIAALAKKAGTLQDLVTSLEAEARKPRGGEGAGRDVTSDGEVSGRRGDLRDFANARGKIRVPVSGRVVAAFGATSGGESSKGISIAARSNASVVAPFDGEVAYTGTFMNYGRMVILTHRARDGDNYHTLLAGLARIDVKQGEFLLEGEPIGAMAGRDSPELYIELRKNNQPINPKPWMRGL